MTHSPDKRYSIKTASGESVKVHPDIDDLSLLLNGETTFGKDSGENNASLKLHVAECLQCQKLLAVLSSLKQLHHTIENKAVSEAQQMLVVDYANRGFSISRKKRLRQKIQDEPSSLKAALHYASHSEAMRLSIEEDIRAQKSNHTDNAKIEKAKKRSSIFSMISRLLKKFKPPFNCSLSFNLSTIYSILISVISVCLLFILLSDKFKADDNNVIKQSEILENNSGVKLEFISNKLNNSGFIYALGHNQSELDKEKDNKGKVSIHLKGKESLHIAWPTPGKMNRYTLDFYGALNREKIPDLSVATTRGFVDLDVQNFAAGEAYRWIFSYQTPDKKMFRAKGGFVIKSFSSKN